MFNKLMRKGFKDQSGMVMPMVLMIMVLALCIVAPGLAVAATTAKVNRDLESSTMAYYAAKAGMEDAFWQIQTMQDIYIPELGNLTVNGMTVKRSLNTSAPLEPGTNTRVITSIAVLKDTEKAKIFSNIEVTYSPATLPTSRIPPTQGTNGYPFQYAVATTGGNITIMNGTKITYTSNTDGIKADIFANGKIIKQDNIDIDGSGYYTDTTPPLPTPIGFEDGVANIDSITFQSLNQSFYWNLAQAGTAYPTTWSPSATAIPVAYTGTTYTFNAGSSTYHPTHTINLGGANQISHVNGNLELNGNIKLNGPVWVTGWIRTLGSTCEIETDPLHPEKQYYLIAQGINSTGYGITIDGGTHIDDYGTNGTGNLNLIAVNGGIVYLGALNSVGGSGTAVLGVTFAPNGTVKFDDACDGEVGCVLGKSVQLDGNNRITYNTNLRNIQVEGFELNVAPSPEIPANAGTPASAKMKIVNISGQ